MTKSDKTLKERTAGGILWGGFNSGVQQLIGVLAGTVLARILVPDDYGVVAVLYIFTGIALILQDSGFMAGLINKKSIEHGEYNAFFWFNIIVGSSLYIILFFCAPLIADFYDKPLLVTVSRVYFLSLLFGSAGSTHATVLLKKLMVKEKAKIESTSLLIAASTGIVLAILGFGYWALVANTVLYTFFMMTFRWYYSPWRPTFNINLRPLMSMIAFSSRILITNILSVVSGNIFSNILGFTRGMDVTGLYSEGKKWTDMGSNTIWNTLSSVSHPVLAEVADNANRQKNVFRKMIRFASFISFPAMFGLALIAREFIPIVVTEKWMATVPIIQILCVWGAFLPLANLYSSMFISRGKSDIHMLCTIVIAVAQLAAVSITSRYGLFPMITVYVAMNMSGLMLWQYFARKHLGVKYSEIIFRDVLPFLAVAFVSLVLAYLAAMPFDNIYIRITIKIATAAACYIGIMYLSGAVIFAEAVAFIRSAVFRNKRTTNPR